MQDREATSKDLTEALSYNSKFIFLSFPSFNLSEEEESFLNSWVDQRREEGIGLQEQFVQSGISIEVADKHILALHIKQLFENSGNSKNASKNQDHQEKNAETEPEQKVPLFEPLSYPKNPKNPLGSSFNNPLSPFSNPNFYEHFRDPAKESAAQKDKE